MPLVAIYIPWKNLGYALRGRQEETSAMKWNKVSWKCPNMEFFWSVFSLSLAVSAFSPSTGKYGPEKNPYLETFHEV